MTDVQAFTTQQACRLSGLSIHRLRYWDKTGFFSPRFIDEERRYFGKIYTFRDIVGLRTIAVMRDEHHLSLQELRKIGKWLHERFDEPWSRLKFFVAGKRVFFKDPKTGKMQEPLPRGQEVFEFALEEVVADLRRTTRRLQKRDRAQLGKIEQNRYVAHNAHVIAGTRITTSAIWRFRQAGYKYADILREYPRLTRRDLQAAIRFEEDRRKQAV